MDYDDLDAEDLYDLSFDELVTMAKEKPQLTANFMWQLLWGPWVPQRLVNEVDGEAVATELIDDPGAVVAQIPLVNSNPQPSNWTLSAGMRQTLNDILPVTSELIETDQPNGGRWEKEKLRLEKLLELKPKNESGKPSKSSPMTSAQRSDDTKSALVELQFQHRLTQSREVQQSRRLRLGRALEVVEAICGRRLEPDERERGARNLEETWAQRRSEYLKAARSKTSRGRLSSDERAEQVRAFWAMVDGEIARGEVAAPTSQEELRHLEHQPMWL